MGAKGSKFDRVMETAFDTIVNGITTFGEWVGIGAAAFAGSLAAISLAPVSAVVGFVESFLGEPEKPAPINEAALRTENGSLSEDEIWRNAERYRQKLRDDARRLLNMDTVNCYNIAITGQTGAGKSTLINGIRRLADDDDDSAKVGVTECTQHLTKYVCPGFENMVLWDCPGANTLSHPVKTYFQDKMLYAFDFLIVVYSERFKELEAALIGDAIKYNIPVICVRNKANNDLRSEQRKSTKAPKEKLKSDLIAKIYKNTVEELNKLGINSPPPIFVINAWAMGSDDEETFEENKLLLHVAAVTRHRRH